MDKPRASVVGGSLVSFLPGITEQQRQSVQLALLMAERVTRTDHRDGLVQDWYSYYRRRLQYLGWDALTAEQVHWPKPERTVIVDRALQRIDQLAGERHTSSLSLAIPAMLGSDIPLLNFEQRTRQLGLFRLIPCAPSRNGYVDMVLYHESGERELFTTGFLGRAVETKVVKAELVRFNVRLFQQEHEAIVLENVKSVMRNEIRTIHI
ncbi:hypothetical protein ACIPZF_07195 [Pseudomonas sp. NPDC089752]|uniref:hypothetical protein n=1 Tax=Pseudomonas sp. NPDC089752 TaxID=3364472 RepID=UPI0037F2761B